jgi:hypothetical protein
MQSEPKNYKRFQNNRGVSRGQEVVSQSRRVQFCMGGCEQRILCNIWGVSFSEDIVRA